MAQVVEHILGKDEVGSSSLPSSSKKSPEFMRISGFFFFLFYGLNSGLGVYLGCIFANGGKT